LAAPGVVLSCMSDMVEVAMKRALSILPMLLVIALVITPVAHAIPITFVATLSGANEVPPNASPATGFASVVLDATAHTLQINVTFSGLTSIDTAAHIH